MRRLVGQLVVVGFDGHEVSPELRSLIREFRVGGIILFARNVVDAEQVWELTGAIRRVLPSPPPFIFVDEEGGPVSRLPAPVLRLPPMRTLGATGDASLAGDIGEGLGRQLGALGLHVDLAPVVDVDSNPKNPVIGARSFHRDPHEVARLGVALMQGLQRGGVEACPKHFPGHGDSSADSHAELPTLDHDRERLDRIELVPFRECLAGGADLIMTAHIRWPALDPLHPATLSPLVLPGLLRREMGYGGLVITDDLEMRAIADNYTMEEAVLMGLLATVDLFLICHSVERQREALETLVRLTERDPSARHEMRRRVNRVLSWKRRLMEVDRRAANLRALHDQLAAPKIQRLQERVAALADAESAGR